VDPVEVVDPGIARGLWFALGALVVLLVLGGIENRRRSSGGGLPA
jgi:hypothetical protein